MLTNRPAIDWLTLTTFRIRPALESYALLHSHLGDAPTREHSVMQYTGQLGNGFFVGEGEQKGKRHYMIRLSGDVADWFMFHPLKPPLECSRLDLQLTIPFNEDGYQLFRTSQDVLAQHEREKGQRGRKVNLISSDDGFCTMYVGSRQSERFYRIYVKEHSGDMFLRFEVEFKSKSGVGGRIYRELTKQPDMMGRYLAGELSTLPDTDLINRFRTHLKGLDGNLLAQTRARGDESTTLAWIAKQVMPAFKRCLGNEDTRDRAGMMLYQLYEFYRGLDNE